jgi:hypothetical protein
MGQGMRCKRRAAQHHKVADNASYDRDYCSGLEGMLHKVVLPHRLQVG